MQWLRENHARVINIFQKLDNDRDNVLSTEDFMIALRMLDVRNYDYYTPLFFLRFSSTLTTIPPTWLPSSSHYSNYSLPSSTQPISPLPPPTLPLHLAIHELVCTNTGAR